MDVTKIMLTLNSDHQMGERKKNGLTDMKKDVASQTFLFVIRTIGVIDVP